MELKGKLELVVTRKYVPLLSDFFINAYAEKSNFKDLFFIDYYTRCAYLSGKWNYGPEAKAFGSAVFTEEEKHPKLLIKIFDNIYAIGEETLKLSEKIKNTDFSSHKPEELIALFKEFSQAYKKYALSLMGYNIQFPVEERLRSVLKGRGNVDEDLSVLTAPVKENIAALEQKNLLRLGTMGKDGLDGEIKRHIDEYGWINTRGGQGDPWTKEEVLQRIEELGPDYKGKLEYLESHQIEIQEKSKKLLNDLHAGEDIKYLVDVAKELVYFRTYRTDYLAKIFANVRNLMEAISREMGISFEQLLHMRIREIEEGTEVSIAEIDSRRSDYAILTLKPGEILFSSNPSQIKKWQDEYCESASGQSTEVRGTIANKGIAKGKAKIVNFKKDMGKVELGDILIAPMTTPDMISAMHKAAAFVTDEGGITCHAAIVSRELRKPCIIGTKNATQILKDGDMVEVDAEKGVVRIIK